MIFKHKSRVAKIILLCLSLSVVEKGWVTKTHPFELGAAIVTQEMLYALTLAGSMLWRACTNSNDSAVDRVLQQEIGKFTSRTTTQETHPTVSLPTISQESSRSHTEHIKPISIVKHISSATVKKIDNCEKSRATVSHVTQEWVTQITYAAIPEKEKAASQELVRQITLDWHIHNCQETIRSARASAQKHLFEQIQALNPGVTTEHNANGGTTYYAPNKQFYAYAGPSRQNNSHPVVDRMIRQQYELMRIHNNPELYSQVCGVVDGFTQTCKQLVYGTLIERVTALLHLNDFYISGDTYGRELEETQTALYAAHYHKDGSICMKALADMNKARDIMLKYHGLNHSHRSEFFRSTTHCPDKTACTRLFKKSRKVDFVKISNNSTNQCCKQMLLAFASGDMATGLKIKDHNRHLEDLTVLYNALQAEHGKAIAQQEALLKDQHGILHFNLPLAQRDPLFTALSTHDRTQLQNNPQALASFNDALLMRNRYKQTLHKAWNISQNTDPVVHETLYALIDSGTIPDRIDKIHEVSTNPNITACKRKKIVQVFFLTNGIIKDFAEYDRAQSLKMPAAILEEKHAHTRQLLNHLVYAEHISEDEHLQDECEQAIEYLQKAFATDNKESSAYYLQQAQSLYDRINNPIDNEKIQGTCGTGKLKDISLPGSECLPGTGHIQPSVPYCPGDQYQDRIEKERMRRLNHNPETIPDPPPCGFAGQTLPSFDSDTGPAAEVDDISEGASEGTEKIESEGEEVAVGEDDSFFEEIHVSPPVDGDIENIDDLMSKENQKEDAVIVVNEFTTLSNALVKVAGRGHSKGRTEPNNYEEKLAMDEVMSNPDGTKLEKLIMTDSRWPSEEGWSKYAQNVDDKNGHRIEIHYVYSEKLNQYDDFKFKD